jgi:hypothetical protein
MNILFKLKTEFGEFTSSEISVTEEQYDTIIEKSKNYYTSGYEMHTENGLIIFSPEIVKKSILTVETVIKSYYIR